jgi:hypothetical protein
MFLRNRFEKTLNYLSECCQTLKTAAPVKCLDGYSWVAETENVRKMDRKKFTLKTMAFFEKLAQGGKTVWI